MSRCLCELGLTKIKELVQPDLSHSQLNLLQVVVLHCVRNKLGIDLCVLISCSAFSHFVKELAEVNSNWQVNEHILVKTSVVIAFNWLDIFELSKTTERVSSAHKFFETTVALKAFNDKDNVVNLVPMKHLFDKGTKGVDCLGTHELNLCSELLLHGTTK